MSLSSCTRTNTSHFKSQQYRFNFDMISSILSSISRNTINRTTSAASNPSSTSTFRFFSCTPQASLPSPRSNNPTVPRGFKSHSGAKKRYSPVGRASGSSLQMFKRGRTGTRHLNSGMSRERLNRLGGTVIERGGNVGKSLRRLLGPSL